MNIFNNLKSNLIKAILLATLAGHIPNSDQRILKENSNLERANINSESYLETNKSEKKIWENVEEYDNFLIYFICGGR